MRRIFKKYIATALAAAIIVTSGMIPQSNTAADLFGAAAVEVSAVETRSYTEYNPYSFYDAFVWIYDDDMIKYNDYLNWLLYMDREGIDLASSRGVEEWEYSKDNDRYPAKALYYYFLEVKNAYDTWRDSEKNNTLPQIMYAKENTVVYDKPNGNIINYAGFTACATVYVVENMSNGWSKVIVTKPWASGAVLNRINSFAFSDNYAPGIFGNALWYDDSDNAISVVGYVKTDQLKKKQGKVYFETSTDFEDKQQREYGYSTISKKRIGFDEPKVCPQVFCNINSRIKYVTRKELKKLYAAYGDDSNNHGFGLGGFCSDASSGDYGSSFSNYIFIGYSNVGWGAWDSTDVHESTHALENYICKIFENTSYCANERLNCYETGVDFAAYYLPMMFDGKAKYDDISEYSIGTERICELSADLVGGVVYCTEADIKEVKNIKDEFASKKRAKQAIKQVNNYLTAANALVNAQHMLSYYFYMQDSGRIAKPGYYDYITKYENYINSITDDTLAPETIIHYSINNNVHSKGFSPAGEEGDYSLADFIRMYTDLRKNEDYVSIGFHDRSDNYFNYCYNCHGEFFEKGMSISGDISMEEFLKDFDIKGYQTTEFNVEETIKKGVSNIEYELDIYPVHVIQDFEEFVKSTEYGKKISENLCKPIEL